MTDVLGVHFLSGHSVIGNGNVCMGKYWKWEQMFGWRENGIKTYGNGRAQSHSHTPLMCSSTIRRRVRRLYETSDLLQNNNAFELELSFFSTLQYTVTVGTTRKTRNFALAERPRDASCLPVYISFNRTVSPAVFYSYLLRLQIY